MHRIDLQHLALATLLLGGCGFATSVIASCSSYISAPNEATLTCTAAADAITISQVNVPGGGVYWFHDGPSQWIGPDFWDAGGAPVSAGGTIRIAGLNGASVTIGDQTYTPADALNGAVILNQGAGGGQVVFDAATSSSTSTWIVNDGATPYATTVNSLTFTNNGSAHLTINTGQAMNLVNVWSVYGSDILDVVGHGISEVDVGNSTTGTMQAIYGPVHVSNACCATLLKFHDWNDSVGRNILYTASSLSGLAPAVVDWPTSDISGVVLYTGTGADSVNVQSTFEGLTIHGTNGADTVTLGNAGSVQSLVGAVTIDNPSHATHLNIDDSADTATRIATLEDSGITGLAPAAIQWTAGDIGSVTLTMGTADDTLAVHSTMAPVAIQGTGGHDTVNIGFGGSVQGILGAVDVRNFLSRTALNIGDSADSVARTATYSKTGVSGLAPAPITWLENDVSAVTLSMGSGKDTVNVLSAFSGSNDALTIHGTNGADSVYFGNAGSARQILTDVNIDNALNYTAIFIDDSADTLGRSVAYSNSGISGVAPGRIGWAGNDVGSVRLYLGSGDDAVHVASSNRNVGGHSFVNVIDMGPGDNQCVVNGSGLGVASVNSFYGNGGDDQFTVSPVAGSVSTLNVFGGSQVSGDSLVYTGGAASGAFPGNGTLMPADPNAHSINYNSIEAFSINDVIFRDGFQ